MIIQETSQDWMSGTNECSDDSYIVTSKTCKRLTEAEILKCLTAHNSYADELITTYFESELGYIK